MGLVYAEITLENEGDVTGIKRGLVKEQEIRQETVTAIVDTGAITMVINEKLRQQLGLGIQGDYPATLADDSTKVVKIAESVRIHWKDRSMVCEPLVVPGDRRILLGAVPLEMMDLIVDPKRNELVGAHGDQVLVMI